MDAHSPGSQSNELAAPIRQQPQCHRHRVGLHLQEIGAVQADQRDRIGVDVIRLAAVPPPNTRTNAA